MPFSASTSSEDAEWRASGAAVAHGGYVAQTRPPTRSPSVDTTAFIRLSCNSRSNKSARICDRQHATHNQLSPATTRHTSAARVVDFNKFTSDLKLETSASAWSRCRLLRARSRFNLPHSVTLTGHRGGRGAGDSLPNLPTQQVRSLFGRAQLRGSNLVRFPHRLPVLHTDTRGQQ